MPDTAPQADAERSAASGTPTPTIHPALPAPRRILFIRPSALGDVARSAPALAALRAAFPDAKIDWLVQDAFLDAVAHHPALTRAIPFARQGLRYAGLRPRPTAELLRLRRTLRSRRYDLAIDAQGLLRSALLAWLSGAPRRLGDAAAREGATLFYTHRHRIDPAIQHAALRELALLEPLGIPQPPADPRAATLATRLHPPPADQGWADRWLAEHKTRRRGFIALAPTTRWLSKDWPLDRYAALARRLLDAGTTERVVVLAAPAEWPRIAPAFSGLPPTRWAAPRTTVGQLMALLERAQLLVCNDSAALHLAVGLDTPTVSIFGPTDPARVGPLGQAATVLRPPHAPPGNTHRQQPDDQTLISAVTLNEVLEAIAAEVDSSLGSVVG